MLQPQAHGQIDYLLFSIGYSNSVLIPSCKILDQLAGSIIIL